MVMPLVKSNLVQNYSFLRTFHITSAQLVYGKILNQGAHVTQVSLFQIIVCILNISKIPPNQIISLSKRYKAFTLHNYEQMHVIIAVYLLVLLSLSSTQKHQLFPLTAFILHCHVNTYAFFCVVTFPHI